MEKPKTPGYAVEVEEVKTVSNTSTEVTKEKVDIAALMTMGDISHGEKVLKNVRLVILLLKEVRTILDLHFTTLLVEKLEL